jgi:hypothetical protein
MIAHRLLDRLEKVRSTGPGRWSACCPSHRDGTPSLSIREADDGRLLIHCFAGCDVGEIVAAIGLGLEQLFPIPLSTPFVRGRRERLITARQGLEIVAQEALVTAVIGSDAANGKPVTRELADRLWLAAGRIRAAYSEVAE